MSELDGSVHSTMSISSPLSLSHRLMTVLRGRCGFGGIVGDGPADCKRPPASGRLRTVHPSEETRMRLFVTLLAGFALAGPLRAQNEPAKPNTLTPQEIAAGWLLLFDGESTFGWKAKGDLSVSEGVLSVAGEKATLANTTAFAEF